MTKRADRIMEDRCKRTGSNWRCPEKPLPGKIYCDKHYKYSITRNNCRKVKKTSAVKCNSSVVSASASAAVVEPYRPVIDFDAPEVGGSSSGGGGNVGSLVNEGELMGWLLGDNGWNDQFASRDSSGGGRGGGNDDFTLRRENAD